VLTFLAMAMGLFAFSSGGRFDIGRRGLFLGDLFGASSLITLYLRRAAGLDSYESRAQGKCFRESGKPVSSPCSKPAEAPDPRVIVPRYRCRILQSRDALVPDRSESGRFVHTGELGDRQFTLREAEHVVGHPLHGPGGRVSLLRCRRAR
jgi:hypothetical protein